MSDIDAMIEPDACGLHWGIPAVAIKSVGVEFIDENGGGPGVRLKKAKRETRKK